MTSRSARWSAHAHCVVGPGSTQVLLGHPNGLGFVGDDDIDDTVRPLHRRSARSPSGSNTPSPPPSIMAGPPMPMLESSVAMTTSQHPRIAALPAKQ